MNRRDFYYRQLVTEADLDEVFTLAEDADHALTLDSGLVGVYFGLDVEGAVVPNLTAQVSAGGAYDQTGQRIAVPSTQIVNLAVDNNAVTTEVAGFGNVKIISVFIKFKRVLGNVKIDGNNVNVQYDRDGGYEFVVRQSTESPAPTPPALQADEILLGDWTRGFDSDVFNYEQWGIERRQWAISVTAGDYTIATGRVQTAFQSVVDSLNTLAGAGGAVKVGYAGGPAWADGTTNPATTVEAQLDKVVVDLAGAEGAAKVGYGGGSAWADGTTNPAAAVETQLDKIVTDLAGAAGSAKVYSALQDAGGGYSIPAGTLASQLLSLINRDKTHATQAVGAHAATAVSNTAAGNIAATTVQAAINELDSEKGGLALANTWTLANTFNAEDVHKSGMSLVPTSGQKYIKLRSTVAGDATDAVATTLIVRYSSTYPSNGGALQELVIIPASDIPNGMNLLLDVVVSWGRNAGEVIYHSTTQKWFVSFRKKADGSFSIPDSIQIGTTLTENSGAANGAISWVAAVSGTSLSFQAFGGGGWVSVGGFAHLSRNG